MFIYLQCCSFFILLQHFLVLTLFQCTRRLHCTLNYLRNYSDSATANCVCETSSKQTKLINRFFYCQIANEPTQFMSISRNKGKQFKSSHMENSLSNSIIGYNNPLNVRSRWCISSHFLCSRRYFRSQ